MTEEEKKAKRAAYMRAYYATSEKYKNYKKTRATKQEVKDRKNAMRREKWASDPSIKLKDKLRFRTPKYKEISKNNRLKGRALRRQWINEYKTKCSICGETDINVLDFHHKDSNTKDFIIASAVTNLWSKDKIYNEILKCIVVCGNCHRKIHVDDLVDLNKTPKNNTDRLRNMRRKWILELKEESGGCKYCGEKDIYVLDFHHEDESVKTGNVGSAVSNLWSRDRLIMEARKCVCICHNCHRKKHKGNRWHGKPLAIPAPDAILSTVMQENPVDTAPVSQESIQALNKLTATSPT